MKLLRKFKIYLPNQNDKKLGKRSWDRIVDNRNKNYTPHPENQHSEKRIIGTTNPQTTFRKFNICYHYH